MMKLWTMLSKFNKLEEGYQGIREDMSAAYLLDAAGEVRSEV